MPRYRYSAKSSSQETVQGLIDAETTQDAILQLTRTGYFPLTVDAADSSHLNNRQSMLKTKISRRELALFTRQLSSLTESGINIINGLIMVAKQMPNKGMQALLGEIIDKIKDGSSLAESLSFYPQAFPRLYTAMIHSGESGGKIEPVLRELSDYLEKEEEFKNAVWAALTYPLFVLIAGIASVTVLIGFVVPRLASMFTDMGESLPFPTRVVISFSQGIGKFGIIVAALFVVVIILWQRLRRTSRGRAVIDTLKIKIFLSGEVVLKTEISRLMRTLSLLLSSGMPITPSLEIASLVTDNAAISLHMQKVREQISKGANLSGSLKETKFFPDLVISIIAVGEETGALDKALLRVALNYERDVDVLLKTVVRLLEPSIILIMGLVVSFIVFSMLLPIFQINMLVK